MQYDKVRILGADDIAVFDLEYNGNVRHVIDFTLLDNFPFLHEKLLSFPGFKLRKDNSKKRVSFITARGTNYYKNGIPGFLNSVYSKDSRIHDFNKLFIEQNKNNNYKNGGIGEEKAIYIYDMIDPEENKETGYSDSRQILNEFRNYIVKDLPRDISDFTAKLGYLLIGGVVIYVGYNVYKNKDRK